MTLMQSEDVFRAFWHDRGSLPHAQLSLGWGGVRSDETQRCVAQAVFSELPVGNFQDWHSCPQTQFVTCLSGSWCAHLGGRRCMAVSCALPEVVASRPDLGNLRWAAHSSHVGAWLRETRIRGPSRARTCGPRQPALQSRNRLTAHGRVVKGRLQTSG